MPGGMMGVLRPAVCRFRLGQFEITNVLDGVSRRDGPHPMFEADQPTAAVERLLLAQSPTTDPLRTFLHADGREHRARACAV